MEPLPRSDTIPGNASRRKARGKLLVILIVLALVGSIAADAVYVFTGMKLYAVPAASMEPTLMGHDAGVNPVTGQNYAETVHDRILVNRRAYRNAAPKFGDIIAFKAPKEADLISLAKAMPQQEQDLVKRIIGLPGDTIQVKDGAVYRNGKKLDEPIHVEGKEAKGQYEILEPISDPQPPNAIYATDKPITLGPNQLFVMGDNRNDSNDCRYWGPLERSRIIGKVTEIVAPSNRARSFP